MLKKGLKSSIEQSSQSWKIQVSFSMIFIKKYLSNCILPPFDAIENVRTKTAEHDQT